MITTEYGSHPLHEELASIVGDTNVFDDADKLHSYSQDYSPFPPMKPGIIVRPGTSLEISDILKLANLRSNPVIVRGGGASLTGYPQTAPSRCIVLETRRLNRILEVDEESLLVRSECGILMSELEEPLEARGLYVNTVSIPVRYATLGGVLSGVVGGGIPRNVASVGLDADYLAGLCVIFPSGKQFRTGSSGANIHSKSDFMRGGNAPDLTGLFIGDGGIFGVKIEATLRVFPKPTASAAGSFSFDNFAQAWRVFLKLTLADPLPYSRISFQEEQAGDQKIAMTYITASQEDDYIQYSREKIRKVCSGEGAPKELPIAHDRDPETIMKLTRGLVAFICRKREFPENYQRIRRLIDDRIKARGLGSKGVRINAAFSPVGRNAAYASISVIYDPKDDAGKLGALELVKDSYRELVQMGCCPEPHQGFASEVMGASWAPELHEFLKGFKTILDPNNILNTGLWNL